MKHIALSLFFAALTALALPSTANDAAFWGDGATVFAIAQEHVRMESERVVVRHDGSAPRNERWSADCTFVFANTSGEAVELQMGHPDWRTWEDSPDRSWAIRAFEVSVDGEAVEATHKKIEKGLGGPTGAVKLRYDAAYTWPVRIPAGGRVEVRNRYRFGGYSSNGPMRACLGDDGKRPGVRDLFWRRAGAARNGWDFENSTCRTVRYIVSTAATWAGPIGRAEISIELPEGVHPHLFLPLPRATEVEGRWVHWRFEDWSPEEELELVLVGHVFHSSDDGEGEGPPLFDTAAQARAWIRFAELNGFGPAPVSRLVAAHRSRAPQAAQDPRIIKVLTRFRDRLIRENPPPITGSTAPCLTPIITSFSKDPAKL